MRLGHTCFSSQLSGPQPSLRGALGARGVWITERGSGEEALSAVITRGAGDLVWGAVGASFLPAHLLPVRKLISACARG